MASKNVEWTSFSRLACAGCTPANVLLCTTFDSAVVPAQLVSFQTLKNGCGGKFYRYVFNYDTEDLPEGVTGLTCANITGAVCKGCLTDWVEQEVADAIAALQIDVTAEIAAAIAAARPLIFNDETREDEFSFLADPTTSHDVDLVITNPSATRPLEVKVAWGFGMDIQSSDDFDAASITGQLQVDGVNVTGEVAQAAARWSLDGIPAHLDFGSPGGSYGLTVAAGDSVTVTLHLTAAVSAASPDLVFAAEDMFVSAFGVTS